MSHLAISLSQAHLPSHTAVTALVVTAGAVQRHCVAAGLSWTTVQELLAAELLEVQGTGHLVRLREAVSDGVRVGPAVVWQLGLAQIWLCLLLAAQAACKSVQQGVRVVVMVVGQTQAQQAWMSALVGRVLMAGVVRVRHRPLLGVPSQLKRATQLEHTHKGRHQHPTLGLELRGH